MKILFVKLNEFGSRLLGLNKSTFDISVPRTDEIVVPKTLKVDGIATPLKVKKVRHRTLTTDATVQWDTPNKDYAQDVDSLLNKDITVQ